MCANLISPEFEGIEAQNGVYPACGQSHSCGEFTKPADKLGADVAALGMKSRTGAVLPGAYRNAMLIAHRGSLNRDAKQGCNAIHVSVNAKGCKLMVKNNFVASHAGTLVGQQHIPRLAGQRKNHVPAQRKAFKFARGEDFDDATTAAAQGLAAAEWEPIAECVATFVAR